MYIAMPNTGLEDVPVFSTGLDLPYYAQYGLGDLPYCVQFWSRWSTLLCPVRSRWSTLLCPALVKDDRSTLLSLVLV